jgi:hypothetical protein
MSRIRRELSFITDKDYKYLRQTEKDLLKEFRRTLRYKKQNEETSKQLRQEIRDRRQKIDNYNEQLTNLYNRLSPLVEKFYFSCSITRFKKGPNKTEYVNLQINRPGQMKRSIGLGRKDKMISMLIQSYPNDIGKIKKNWFSFLKIDSNIGKVYDIIHKEIMKNPTDDKVQLDKHDLFPIRDKS